MPRCDHNRLRARPTTHFSLSQPQVLLFENRNASLFSPGHMVLVDYDENAVYVCIRGTASTSDVLVDLVCHAVPYRMGRDFASDRLAL